jgi:Holliday junction resolvase RusA-like endonuclease
MTEQRITFKLEGPPVPWHRARLSRSNRIDGGGVRHYKDKKDIAYQKAISTQAMHALQLWAQSFKKPWDPSGEWEMECEFNVHDLVKKDVDNLGKQAMDALSGVAYDDDKQVVRMIVTKRLNREKPSTTVTIRRVHGYLEERSAEAGVDLGAP